MAPFSCGMSEVRATHNKCWHGLFCIIYFGSYPICSSGSFGTALNVGVANISWAFVCFVWHCARISPWMTAIAPCIAKARGSLFAQARWGARLQSGKWQFRRHRWCPSRTGRMWRAPRPTFRGVTRRTVILAVCASLAPAQCCCLALQTTPSRCRSAFFMHVLEQSLHTLAWTPLLMQLCHWMASGRCPATSSRNFAVGANF